MHSHYDDDMEDQDIMPALNFEEHVDNGIFEQILEMDDDDKREFSKSLVTNFFDQAEETFVKIEEVLNNNKVDDAKRLETLSSLGHFLKGSSATLGFNKIRDSCQIIQQYGHKLNVDGSAEPNEQVCLDKIKGALETARNDKDELAYKMFNKIDGFFKPHDE
ncbi:signal transduction histidine kinase [Pseudoneurospora amorphoporcata]|uniref:Signal transduction histidine kinase n=1 Tax=Pseudoneurospora amorphoporcata TaxID=241081 RepID=A0AAN6NYY0_9PEZI|nr:signal transduction histidine kinase [Pseudoneurospora amorphoporcata]